MSAGRRRVDIAENVPTSRRHTFFPAEAGPPRKKVRKSPHWWALVRKGPRGPRHRPRARAGGRRQARALPQSAGPHRSRRSAQRREGGDASRPNSRCPRAARPKPAGARPEKNKNRTHAGHCQGLQAVVSSSGHSSPGLGVADFAGRKFGINLAEKPLAIVLTPEAVQILAIVMKSEAETWLAQFGSPE